MLCERCRKKESTVHLTEIIKGARSEVHLCDYCAKDIGLNSKLNSYSLSIPDMLSFMNEDAGEILDRTVCSSCGRSGSDIETQGRTGCPGCYDSLNDYLEIAFPEFQTGYKGKRPQNIRIETIDPADSENEKESDSDLLVQLDDAIREERYEDAARIRDSLRGNQ